MTSLRWLRFGKRPVAASGRRLRRASAPIRLGVERLEERALLSGGHEAGALAAVHQVHDVILRLRDDLASREGEHVLLVAAPQLGVVGDVRARRVPDVAAGEHVLRDRAVGRHLDHEALRGAAAVAEVDLVEARHEEPEVRDVDRLQIAVAREAVREDGISRGRNGHRRPERHERLEADRVQLAPAPRVAILAELRQTRTATGWAGTRRRDDDALAWQVLGKRLPDRSLALEGGDGRRLRGRDFSHQVVFGGIAARSGASYATIEVLRRCWTLYVAHIFLFVLFTAQVAYTAEQFANPMFIDEMRVAGFLEEPHVAIVKALALQFQPEFLNILPLYILLLLAFAITLPIPYLHGWHVLVPSVLLYIAAQIFRINLPTYPGGHWYFNPLAWQLLFFIGVVCSGQARTGGLAFIANRNLFAASLVILALSLLAKLVLLVDEFFDIVPPDVITTIWPFIDKTYLGPLRLLNFLALAIVVVRLVPRGGAVPIPEGGRRLRPLPGAAVRGEGRGGPGGGHRAGARLQRAGRCAGPRGRPSVPAGGVPRTAILR